MTVARDLAAMQARTGADEIIATCAIYDHEARKRSISIAMEAMEVTGG